MAISEKLFLAILSMDAYNRGYGRGIASAALSGTEIGKARVASNSSVLGSNVDVSASFFAQSYTSNGKTVIAYRGTDNPSVLSGSCDIWRGWTIGAGWTRARFPRDHASRMA